jgi:hypothetical protein
MSEASDENLSVLAQIVRDELRAAFVEEFRALGEASQRAAEALQSVRRAASARVALWSLGVVLACSAIPVTVAWVALPSRASVQRLRNERDALETRVAELARRGGRVDLRRCGASGRLCARVDRSSPAYGADGDYLILKGY